MQLKEFWDGKLALCSIFWSGISCDVPNFCFIHLRWPISARVWQVNQVSWCRRKNWFIEHKTRGPKGLEQYLDGCGTKPTLNGIGMDYYFVDRCRDCYWGFQRLAWDDIREIMTQLELDTISALIWLLADLNRYFTPCILSWESTIKLTNDKNVDKTLGEYGWVISVPSG